MADQKTPSPGEIVIMSGGALALIFSFFDFVGIPGGGGISAWGKTNFPVVTLMVIFVVVMAAQIALTRFAGVNLPEQVAGFSWVQIHLALGFFAALDALAFLVRSNGGYDRKIGFWMILVGSIGAFVGAILLQKERAGGASSGGGSSSSGPSV
jgi:hypothetical protein